MNFGLHKQSTEITHILSSLDFKASYYMSWSSVVLCRSREDMESTFTDSCLQINVYGILKMGSTKQYNYYVPVDRKTFFTFSSQLS